MRVESKIFRMDRALLKIAIQKGRLRCFSPKSDNIHFFFFSESNGLVPNGCWSKCKREQRNNSIHSQRETSVIWRPER